jgi:hypothetical protein
MRVMFRSYSSEALEKALLARITTEPEEMRLGTRTLGERLGGCQVGSTLRSVCDG